LATTGVSWAIAHDKAIPSSFNTLKPSVSAGAFGGPRPPAATEEANLRMDWRGPGFACTLFGKGTRDQYEWRFGEYRFGWPLPALAFTYDCTDRSSLHPSIAGFSGGIRVPGVTASVSNPSGTLVSYALLPTTVFALPFLIDSLLYGACVFVVVMVPVAARRAMRKRRGGCPSCGYTVGDLPICPECGRARDVETSLSAKEQESSAGSRTPPES
jgi:hypothetical protein